MFSSSKWPPLNYLRGFEAAARLNSFSKAANELNMTQSAVSHQIKALEDYLGQDLFVRVNRKVVLSDAGIDLLATTEECLSILADGFKRLDQYKKPNQLIVHTSSAFASNWLLSRLSEYRRASDHADVWLYTTDGEPDLDLVEVHLAILYGRGRWPGMSKTLLFTDRFAPLCAPDHPIMRIDDCQPQDLLEHTLLHSEHKENWHSWFAARGMDDINPIIGPNFTNPSLMLDAARQGQGIALGSLILAAGLIESGELVSPVPHGLSSRFGYYLVARHEGLESPKVSPFADWLNDQADDFHNQHFRALQQQFSTD